jgi:hypothetical protein
MYISTRYLMRSNAAINRQCMRALADAPYN